MAIVKANSLLSRISGKLSKKEDTVFYWKFGKNFVWRNEGFRGPFSTSQLAAQALFTSAAAAKVTLMANTTQVAQYKTAFKAQSKYLTLNGYIMAKCIENAQNAATQTDNQGTNNPE